MLFYILNVHFQGAPDDGQANISCNIMHLKTVHHRAVMRWMSMWLAEVYLPSTGPKSQDIAVRYVLLFVVSLI